MNDVKLAFRQLVKSPGFGAVAVLSLALGIGANTAIFSLVNEVLLRSLPVRNPGELVLLRTIEGARGRMSRFGENNGFIDPATGRFGSTSFSMYILERLRSQRSALSDIFAFAPFSNVNVVVDGQPEIDVSAQYMSGDYYEGLGVPALIGRTLARDDDRPASAPVAVVSFRYWQRRFAADPRVLGAVILINRVPATIVGVTPAGVRWSHAGGGVGRTFGAACSLPPFSAGPRGARAALVLVDSDHGPAGARGHTGAGARVARADLPECRSRGVARRSASHGWSRRSRRSADARRRSGRAGGKRYATSAMPSRCSMLMVLVGLVLVFGLCQRREPVSRAWRGSTAGDCAASRARREPRRLVRQLFVDPWLSRALARCWEACSPGGDAVCCSPSGRSARPPSRSTCLSMRACSASPPRPRSQPRCCSVSHRRSAPPEWISSAQFQGGTRSLGSAAEPASAQTLMVVQIALSLVLLISTGLFVRTLANLERVDAGFNRRDLIVFRIDATSAGYPRDQYPALEDRLQARLERVPGVRAVTFSRVALLSGVRQNKRIVVPGHTPPPGASMIVNTNGLAAEFLYRDGVPLVLGRGFTDRDNGGAPPVAVVNQAFVRTYFDGQHPLGHSIRVGAAPRDQVVIVGVAADAKYTDLRGPAPATIYFRPASAWMATRRSRCASDARRWRGRERGGRCSRLSRTAVREIDPALPALDLRTEEQQVDRLHAQQLLFARLSGSFGMFAIALACVGLYGLISQTVTKRKGEIGLRMALGAAPSRYCEWFSANRSRSFAWGLPSARCRRMPRDASSPRCSSASRPPIR